MTGPRSRAGASGGCPAVSAGLCLFVLAIGEGHAEETAPPKDPPTEQELDLRLPELHRFIRPDELGTPLPEQFDDVTIWAHPETPDMVQTRPVPGGLGGLFWGLWHPTQIWRLFVPDPNLRISEEDDRRP